MPCPRRAISAPSSRAAIRYDSRAPALEPAKTQLRWRGAIGSLPQHALEDSVHVAQLAVEVEAGGELGGGKQLLPPRVLAEQVAEITVLVPDLHRVALHHHVGRLPLHALLDQLEQDR